MKRVRISIIQLKTGRWRGTVYVNGENFAGVEGSNYYNVLQQSAHYAAGVSSEMGPSGPGWTTSV